MHVRNCSSPVPHPKLLRPESYGSAAISARALGFVLICLSLWSNKSSSFWVFFLDQINTLLGIGSYDFHFKDLYITLKLKRFLPATTLKNIPSMWQTLLRSVTLWVTDESSSKNQLSNPVAMHDTSKLCMSFFQAVTNISKKQLHIIYNHILLHIKIHEYCIDFFYLKVPSTFNSKTGWVLGLKCSILKNNFTKQIWGPFANNKTNPFNMITILQNLKRVLQVKHIDVMKFYLMNVVLYCCF